LTTGDFIGGPLFQSGAGRGHGWPWLLRSFELSEMFRLAESQAIGLSSLITLLPFRLLADGSKIDHLSHSVSWMVTSEFQFYVQVTLNHRWQMRP